MVSAYRDGYILGFDEGNEVGTVTGKALVVIAMMKNNMTKEDAFKYTNADDEVKQKVDEILESLQTYRTPMDYERAHSL